MGRRLIKMTSDQVAEALAMLDAGEILRIIAARFEVSINTIVQHRDRRHKNLHVKTPPPLHVKPAPLHVKETAKRSAPPAHKAKTSTPARIPQYGDEDYVIRISKAWPSDDWTTWTPEQLDTAIRSAKAEGMNFTACYKETGIDKMILMKYFPEFFHPVPRLAPDPEVPDEVRLVDPITKNTDLQ